MTFFANVQEIGHVIFMKGLARDRIGNIRIVTLRVGLVLQMMHFAGFLRVTQLTIAHDFLGVKVRRGEGENIFIFRIILHTNIVGALEESIGQVQGFTHF